MASHGPEGSSAPPPVDARALLPPVDAQADATCREHLLVGTFRYYHYGADGFADHSWGCGYRTAQTILSWLSPGGPVAGIPTLQRALAGARPSGALGPREWIGVPDMVVLADAQGAQVSVRHIASGGEGSRLVAELAAHFDAGGGPVMVGGGDDVYSKTVVGVREAADATSAADAGVPAASAACASLLVLDPHYAGSSAHTTHATRAELLRDGWIAWRPISTLLRADSFYNLGLPRRVAPAAKAALRAAPPPSREAADTDWAALIEVVGSSSP